MGKPTMPRIQDDDCETMLHEAVLGYRRGRTADMIRARIQGVWGTVWTIPPGSPDAMERVGRQLTRSGAEQARHTRRAHLRKRPTIGDISTNVVEAVILTEYPSGFQLIVCLEDGRRVYVTSLLEDEGLAALRRAFIQSTP